MPAKSDGERRERCMEWLRAEAQADTDLATHAAGGCFSDPAMAAECGVCKSLLRFVEAECEREREAALAAVGRSRRQIELSAGCGRERQEYGIAVCDDISADILRGGRP